MTKLLDQAFERARELPDARQDEAARVLLDVVSQDPESIHLSESQLRDLARRLDDPDDDLLAENEVESAFRKMDV